MDGVQTDQLTHIRNFVSDRLLDPPDGSEDRPEKSFPADEGKDLVEQPDGQQDEGAVEDREVRVHGVEGGPDLAFWKISGSDVRIFRHDDVVDAELAEAVVPRLADRMTGKALTF